MEYGILFLLILIIMFYLETLLSQTESKYPGIIIPVMSFIATVVLTFFWADEFSIIKFISTLVFTNIPTYILIGIYMFKRKKISQKNKK